MDTNLYYRVSLICTMIYIIIIKQMEQNRLEEEKIALTKQYEKIQQKIDYYNLDEIANWNSDFKEMIYKRDRIRHKINEIKNILDNNI